MLIMSTTAFIISIKLDMVVMKDKTRFLQSSTICGNEVLPPLIRCLESRFESFSSDIYTHMMWLDPANWVSIETELHHMECLAAPFDTTLQFAGYASSKLKSEWTNLKLAVKYYYSNVKQSTMWKIIFQY